MKCSRLHQKLNEFRRDGKYCNISIRMQNTITKCHRVMLASISEFFDVMFYSTFKENMAEEIVLSEVDPSAFECILEFAYLGKEPNFSESTNNVYDLLKACDFLGVHDLVELCICHIIEHISSIENVCEMYVFSCVSNHPTLSDALSSHIAENFYTVSQNEEFLLLSYEQLNTVMKKYGSLSSGSGDPSLLKDADLLLDMIIRWISHGFQERKKYFLDLVSIVNIENVSKNYLEFLSNEYKLNVDGYIDLKSCLTAFFTSETKCALPALVYKSPLKNSVLYMYVEFENLADSNYLMNVISISKYHSKFQWSSIELGNDCSSEREDLKSSDSEIVALDEPYNYLYFLSHEEITLFYSYSTVTFDGKKALKVPPLEYSDVSKMCGFQNNSIYLYSYFASPGTKPAIRNMVSVLKYKCEVDEWFTVPELKTNISYAKLVADHELVYLIGGTKSNVEEAYSPRYVQAYDYRAPKWQELTKLATGETCGNYPGLCCYLNGKIYASDAKKIEVFDLEAGKWMVLSYNNCIPKRTPVVMHQMLPYENNLWIFYSELPYGSWDIIIFDPNSSMWFPYNSFFSIVASLDDDYTKKYLPDCNSEEGKELLEDEMYRFDVQFLSTVVFKPLDVSANV